MCEVPSGGVVVLHYGDPALHQGLQSHRHTGVGEDCQHGLKPLVVAMVDDGGQLMQLHEEHPELGPQLLHRNIGEKVRLEEPGGVQPPLEVDGGTVGSAGPTHDPDEELEVEDGADALDLGPSPPSAPAWGTGGWHSCLRWSAHHPSTPFVPLPTLSSPITPAASYGHSNNFCHSQ